MADESPHAQLVAAALCVWQGHIVPAAAMLCVCCCRHCPQLRRGLPQWPPRLRRTCSMQRCRPLHPARAALLVHTASPGPSGQELPERCKPCRWAITFAVPAQRTLYSVWGEARRVRHAAAGVWLPGNRCSVVHSAVSTASALQLIFVTRCSSLTADAWR